MGSQRRWRREGGHSAETSVGQMERGSRKEVGRARCAAKGDRRARVWRDPAPPWHASSRLRRAAPAGRPLAGGSTAPAGALGAGPGRASGVCAPVCPGRPDGRRHVDASLARVSRPVGKAGRGARTAGPGASAFEWGAREEGAARLASPGQIGNPSPAPS